MPTSQSLRILAPTLAFLLLGISVRSADQPAVKQTQAALMQQKLDQSHAMLSALALEDYTQLSSSADNLLRIARQQWRTNETPEYRAQLKDFWTVLEGVKSAADEKNLDAATLGYVQMTISCVKCHKTLRKQPE